ncbi:MAG: hypothetical protein JXR94_21055 [Candidatus Hydrogenedentes bacterium]|nr:hypothetical protein [Candidatus Hydrogenedentota bacterium]
MSAREKICVFYSIRHNFERVLENVRKRMPHAAITAMVPKGYAITARERSWVNDIVETERDKYTVKDIGAFFRLLRLARAGRYDRFIVLFASARHRILAGASGARVCECWTLDGHIVPLSRHALSVPIRLLCDAAVGRLWYWRAWLSVHRRRVRPRERR